MDCKLLICLDNEGGCKIKFQMINHQTIASLRNLNEGSTNVKYSAMNDESLQSYITL